MTPDPDGTGGSAGSAEVTLYVYAVVPAGDHRPRVSGIDGAALDVVGPVGGPRAVVHRHAAAPYDGPDDDVKLWILQHSDVVEDAWEGAGAVLPVSFNVIVRPDAETGATAEAQLTAWLMTEGPALRRRLDELTGTSELRVEVSLDHEEYAASNAEMRQIADEMADRPAGVRRLLEKRAEKMGKEITDRAADDLYPELRTRIAGHCVEIEEYRSPARETGLVPVLTASCLVRAPRQQELGAELSAIASEQPAVRIRFLGPWPPYSFAELPGADPA
ncbi:GvpL/GvpF family gas vesicle protein [Georgenia sp. Z1491]|uniref:GvpL/GvpF family gas vesicle protein n=1 Tax=Georgenia sp. Z1491 TaxID=3416707 RepID=UPI003CEB4FB6